MGLGFFWAYVHYVSYVYFNELSLSNQVFLKKNSCYFKNISSLVFLFLYEGLFKFYS